MRTSKNTSATKTAFIHPFHWEGSRILQKKGACNCDLQLLSDTFQVIRNDDRKFVFCVSRRGWTRDRWLETETAENLNLWWFYFSHSLPNTLHGGWCIYPIPWEPTTFIFRGSNPYVGGAKPSFFMVLWSKGKLYFLNYPIFVAKVEPQI